MLGWAVPNEEIRQNLEYVIRSSPPSYLDRQTLPRVLVEVSSFRALPSSVCTLTKSYDQTWFSCSGLNLIQEPSFSHNRPHPGWRLGAFRPS